MKQTSDAHPITTAGLPLATLLLAACGGGGGGSPASAPTAPELTLDYGQVKQLKFSWNDVAGETEYRLLEDPDGSSGFTPVATLAADAGEYGHTVFLPARLNARYILQACNSAGCADSDEITVDAPGMAAAIGYVKAVNTGQGDWFGWSVALSADGSTLAVGATGEDSATGNINDNSMNARGAVYIFTRGADGVWTHQAYLKADGTGADDQQFGIDLALSGDGDTLAVGAIWGDQNYQGAVYVFRRDAAGDWSQQTRLNGVNILNLAGFGRSVAFSQDGDTLAIGALRHRILSGNDHLHAGGAYIYVRENGAWSQEGFVQAANAGELDHFGSSVALSADGGTLAVGAPREDYGADDNEDSGAVYVFTRDANTFWSQQAYLKADNRGPGDQFGFALALSADGNRLIVGAPFEDSDVGLFLPSTNDDAPDSGAAYLFVRDANGDWSQQAFFKSPASDGGNFGHALSLSADGMSLAVSAPGDNSNARGFSAVSFWPSNNNGTVYLFDRVSDTQWDFRPYIKAPNSGGGDRFGTSLAFSADGSTLAVGARGEASAATGIGGDQANNSAPNSGAVYLY